MTLSAFTESAHHDIRYALRLMSRQPLFTATAVLSLALGIGANTAIYSFIEAILLRALPVQDPETLVVLNWRSPDRPAVVHSLNGSNRSDPKIGYTSGNFPFGAFEVMRDKSPDFAAVFAFKTAGRIHALVQNAADLANGEYVSGEFFSGLGVLPAAGRLIGPADGRAGATPVAVLASGYARRHFGDALRSIGQPIRINNTPYTVVGVTPAGFLGVDPATPKDVYLPMQVYLSSEPGPAHDPNRYWVDIMARRRPEVSRTQAQTALAGVFHTFVESTAANDNERRDLPALFLNDGAAGLDFLRRQYSKPLLVLMTMVGLILAIACANIANLLLARATMRRREIALRASLGAGRWRIVRQLLTESVLLASLGGLLAVAFASWGIRALTLLIGNGRENFTLHAALNWNVLAVTTGLSVATGIIFGLAPALHAVRVELNATLKQVRGGSPQGISVRRRITSGHLLVVSQIALSLLLLVGAGLFVRTLEKLGAISLGFEDRNLLLFTVNPTQVGYRSAELLQFYETLHLRLQTLPGIVGVSSSGFPLIAGWTNSTGVNVPGVTGRTRGTSVLTTGGGFFSTLQIPLLMGRGITDDDVRRGAAVAVVNEVFARTYFGGDNPIGRRFGLGATPTDLEVIGVAKNARYNSLKGDIPPVVYLPYSSPYTMKYGRLGQMTFEVRTAGSPLALVPAVREVVRQLDARVPLADIGTQSDRIEQTISQERTFAMLCTAFAVLAVLIACVGLYGTMAYTVARRTAEFGIRMALGAAHRRVAWMVLRQVLGMAIAGLAVGLVVARLLTRVIRTFLFQVEPTDLTTMAGATLILLTAVVVAGYGPARRASRVDPMAALRDA